MVKELSVLCDASIPHTDTVSHSLSASMRGLVVTRGIQAFVILALFLHAATLQTGGCIATKLRFTTLLSKSETLSEKSVSAPFDKAATWWLRYDEGRVSHTDHTGN